MRVLLISYYFPPYNSVGAVRVGKLASYLVRQGHDVRVITADRQAWKGILPTTLRLEIPEAQVVYAGHPLLHRLSSSFVHVLTRGQSTSGHFGWLPSAYVAARRLLHQWKPDIIYASGLPFTAFIAAHWLNRKDRIPWVAELRDLWGDNPTYRGWRKMIESRWERRTLRSASGLVTVSEPLADALRRKYAAPVLVSYNGFDGKDFPRAARPTPVGDDRLTIIYAGSLYKKWRDPTPLFQGMQQLGPLSQKLCIQFYGPDLGFVQEAAAELGVSSSVQVYSPVSYEESLRLQSEADILLLLQWTDPRQKGIFTGKLFEYIGARRPILSIGPTDNEPARLITSKGFGVALERPEDIAAQLQRWLIQKQENGIPSLPLEAALPFTRDVQNRLIEEFLQKFAPPGE